MRATSKITTIYYKQLKIESWDWVGKMLVVYVGSWEHLYCLFYLIRLKFLFNTLCYSPLNEFLYFPFIQVVDSQSTNPLYPDPKQSTTSTIQMADQQEAFKMRKTCKSQFTRAERNLQQALSMQEVETSTIERRFGELQAKFDALQNAHDVYAEFVDELLNEDGTPVDPNLDQYIDELTERFNSIEIEADKKIASRKKKDTTVNPTVVSNMVPSLTPSVIKVKRVDLDPFDGDIRKYPAFKSDFTKLIAPRYGSDNIQLAFALKSYLVPKVREEVESCSDDYPAMWKRLDTIFGDKGRLISTIIEEVTKLQQVKVNDESYSLSMIKVIEKAHRDLSRLDAQTEMANAQTITIIEKRMTTAMRQEWSKEVAGKELTSEAKFNQLLKWLHGWRDRLEYLTDEIRAPVANIQGSTSYLNRDRDSSSSGSKKHVCWLHKEQGGHPIWRCREFIAKPLAERKRLVEINKACKGCLLVTCTDNDCLKRWKCNVGNCGANHNKLLHEEKEVDAKVAHVEGNQDASTILQIQEI